MKIERIEAEAWLAKAKPEGLPEKLRESGADAKGFAEGFSEELIYPPSVCKAGSDVLVMVKLESSRALAVMGENKARFDGICFSSETITLCPLSPENAARLRRILPFTAPTPVFDRDITLGLGDRLGIASPGHLRLIKKLKSIRPAGEERTVAPVLAQQSVRELDLTERSYRDVLDAASWAVFQEGYTSGWGADGDHLKTAAWVKTALKLGFTMITADVSDYIHKEFVNLGDREALSLYEKRVKKAIREKLEARYLSLALQIDTGDTIRFSREELARIVLVYGNAADYAEKLYQAGVKTGKLFDFELSIDETETPTLARAHVFMAKEMQERGINVLSMAPRFVGEFQKGIDYIGNIGDFESSFRIHASIARFFGYRISVHSGSDKFGVFPIVGRQTRYRFHLKTAGTNWLQALLVIAEKEPDFFRCLHRKALERFPAARKYYHITPDLSRIPDPDSLKDKQLNTIFKNPDARQLLHVTYGEMLREPDLKEEIYRVLNKHIEDYWSSLESHIGKHLEYLGLISGNK
jgi:hypothetical protein